DGRLFAGRYRLLREAGPGRGGWLAEDTRDGDAPVVVRRYPGRSRTGFTDLCRRLGEVRHPGIARVRDHGFDDGTPYLVREFVPGRTLRGRLDGAPGELSADEVAALLPPLAEAVVALHAQEGPRGELSAESVVLTPDGPVLTCLDSAPTADGSRTPSLPALGEIVSALYHHCSGALPAEVDRAATELRSDDPGTRLRGADRLRRLLPRREESTGRPEIHFTAGELTGRPEARITLEATVHEILARGSLGPRQYRVDVRPDGYLVRTEPGAYLLPVLVAVLRELPHSLSRLADPPRLRVTFGQPPARPPGTAADVMVVVPPALYDAFAASSAARGSRRFRPLFGDDAPDSPPAAWYCALPQASQEPERDLVQGPFITHDLRELGIPTPGRTAVVHTRPDGPLTLLDPIQPYGTRPPRPETYYSVDLTPRQARRTVSLPSSGKGAFAATVELSWHVDDPVAFVRGQHIGLPGLLLTHLRAAAAVITGGHPLRRAGAAERAVNAGVDGWPVPGLAVSYTVRLVPEGAPAPVPEPSAPARRRPAALLAGAEAVLIGFDGPLARLFSAQTARAAALDLLSVVAEHRDPADAITGRPLGAADAVREAFTHPLDLLRAFAHDRLGPLLRARLDELELDAVPDAPTTHRSVALVRALHRSGRRVSVVTDVSGPAVQRCLEPYHLPLAGIHGRRGDLGLLTPDPDCLRRALSTLGAPAHTGVLISSSVAELTAAQQLGLRFVGYAPTDAGRRRLREGGCEATVSSLEPLLEVARSL
ncbi:SAV_2336 N-terminal domain-related protein, partial [Streptomyces sp. NPDC004561]